MLSSALLSENNLLEGLKKTQQAKLSHKICLLSYKNNQSLNVHDVLL